MKTCWLIVTIIHGEDPTYDVHATRAGADAAVDFVINYAAGAADEDPILYKQAGHYKDPFTKNDSWEFANVVLTIMEKEVKP